MTSDALERALDGRTTRPYVAMVYGFVVGPPLIMLTVFALSWAAGFSLGMSWLNFGLLVGLYVIPILGVTVGYHRYFTHGAFKAKPWLKVVLALAGSFANQGGVVNWVADHRRHHKFSDQEGDPHSPWLYGTSPLAVAKGLWYAHMGWMLTRGAKTNVRQFAPDWLADTSVRRISKLFPLLAFGNLFVLPPMIGWLVTGTLSGALWTFFWASVVRTVAIHHVTWSTNSICHMFGERPFKSRDQSRNLWWLALPSMGESWHNLHHADPTCARHGVRRGEIDVSARVIWLFEKFGWAWNVRWPDAVRLAKKTA